MRFGYDVNCNSHGRSFSSNFDASSSANANEFGNLGENKDADSSKVGGFETVTAAVMVAGTTGEDFKEGLEADSEDDRHGHEPWFTDDLIRRKRRAVQVHISSF